MTISDDIVLGEALRGADVMASTTDCAELLTAAQGALDEFRRPNGYRNKELNVAMRALRAAVAKARGE